MRDLKIFSGRANAGLSRRICQFLNLPQGKISLGDFPDGEIACKIEEDVVEAKPAVHHAPGGDRRVEAAGEEHQDSSLGSCGKASRTGGAIVEKPGFRAVQLDPHFHFGPAQVDASGDIDQSATDGSLDFR